MRLVNERSDVSAPLIIGLIILAIIVVASFGFFSLQPNEARVLVLFGEYKGTVRTTGFYWANPFYSRTLSSTTHVSADNEDKDTSTVEEKHESKISLRARTFNGPKLKVNDKNGNPVEIASVIVWRVVNTAKAVFDIDNYEQFVKNQSETALRHVASLYAYDENEENSTTNTKELTLRSNISEISASLKQELEEHLSIAGIQIDEARLSHLAYAPEIAQVMLRRQQAEAIISARSKIVQGAVSMVDMTIKELEAENVISLDSERKASMVSNLMVVLCSENDAQPVLNTGTLYN